jgi:transposase-like protein
MSKGSMRISENYGVNAAMGICPRCGEDSGILLIGYAKEFECRDCHKKIIGKCPKVCPHCDSSMGFIDHGEFNAQYKKMPLLCQKCEKEIEEFNKAVEAGGVLFKCKECGKEGVVRAESELAKLLEDLLIYTHQSR